MCTSCLLAGSLHVRWCHPHCHWPMGGCPHAQNLCGKPADKFGHHDLRCRSSQGRASCHQMLIKSDPSFIGPSKHSQQTGTIRPIQSWQKAPWWGDLVSRTSPYPPRYSHCTCNCTTAVTQRAGVWHRSTVGKVSERRNPPKKGFYASNNNDNNNTSLMSQHMKGLPSCTQCIFVLSWWSPVTDAQPATRSSARDSYSVWHHPCILQW